MSAPRLGRSKTHESRAIGLLTSAFRNKPVVRAYVRALAREVQEIEDTLWDILFSRLLRWADGVTIPYLDAEGGDPIVDATGPHLDLAGAFVGVARLGRSDAAYALAIRLRVRSELSEALEEDIIAVARLAAPDAVVSYAEAYPAAILLSVAPVPADGVAMIEALTRARAAGVALQITLGVTPAVDDGFTWGWTSGPVVESTLWAWTSGTADRLWGYGAVI